MQNQTEETIPTQPLSVGWLADVLRTKVLTGNYRLPNAQALSILSDKLTKIRKINRLQRDSWKPAADRAFGTLNAANTLLAELPKFRREFVEFLQVETNGSDDTGFPDFILEKVKMEIEAVDAVLSGLKTLLGSVALNVQPGKIGSAFERWKPIAPMLCDSFREAMASTNPNSEIGNSGPLPRFLEAVIPEITGEEPAATSIGQRLKEMNRSAQ